MGDIGAEIFELRQQLVNQYGVDVDLIALAAIGITRHAWRSDWNGYVEEAHTVGARRYKARITDGEMFAANVATTRVVLEHIRSYPDLDWDLLAQPLIDPNRLAGQRTLIDLLGKTRHGRWAGWARKYFAALEALARDYGPDYVLVTQAKEGMACSGWWAGPRWPELVDTFINQLTEQASGIANEELRGELLNAPDGLDPEVLDWCVVDQSLGYAR